MWLRLECTQIPHPPHPRLLVERFSGRFWTWLDREEFLVPKNVLDIVASQTVTWMGLFYCPLLPLLNSAFLFLTFSALTPSASRCSFCSGASSQQGLESYLS